MSITPTHYSNIPFFSFPQILLTIPICNTPFWTFQRPCINTHRYLVSPTEAPFIYPLPLFLSGHLMCQRLHTYSNSSLSFLSLNISHLRVKTTHMAKRNLDFLCSNQIKYRQPHSLILLFVFVSTVNSAFSNSSYRLHPSALITSEQLKLWSKQLGWFYQQLLQCSFKWLLRCIRASGQPNWTNILKTPRSRISAWIQWRLEIQVFRTAALKS